MRKFIRSTIFQCILTIVIFLSLYLPTGYVNVTGTMLRDVPSLFPYKKEDALQNIIIGILFVIFFIYCIYQSRRQKNIKIIGIILSLLLVLFTILCSFAYIFLQCFFTFAPCTPELGKPLIAVIGSIILATTFFWVKSK